MFHKSKLMFWTSEVLLLTIIFFIWRQMGDMITPIVSVVNTILIPFLVGGFLYYITNPLVKFLQDKLKINRMIGILITVAGQYADKAVNIGFDNISLNKTETDIIAQIDFAIKREGYEMSFETMVLTGNNAANPHGIPGANKIENNALLLFDLGCMVNGYASDMTRTVAVGQPDQFKKDIYYLTLEAQKAALDFIKPRS